MKSFRLERHLGRVQVDAPRPSALHADPSALRPGPALGLRAESPHFDHLVADGGGSARFPLRGWHLHFKGGWGSRPGLVNHQVVLLSKDGRRIGLAVMTEHSPSHEYGEDTLEGVFRILLRDLPG